jgi:hypothetical protein
MAPRRKSLNRRLTTAEKMLAMIGPSPAALVRSGVSPKRAQAAEREWERWNERYGFSWRATVGIATNGDRERLAAGERPEPGAPSPPGLDVVA